MDILLMHVGAYFVNAYWWLFCWCLLVRILLMPIGAILLMPIGGYFVNAY
jgi:hypothetical protein